MAKDLYSIVASYAYIFNFSKLWKQTESYGETDYVTSYKNYDTIPELKLDKTENKYKPYQLTNNELSFQLTIDERPLYKEVQDNDNDIDTLWNSFTSEDGCLNIKLQSDKTSYKFYQFTSTLSNDINQGGPANSLSYKLLDPTQESEDETQ